LPDLKLFSSRVAPAFNRQVSQARLLKITNVIADAAPGTNFLIYKMELLSFPAYGTNRAFPGTYRTSGTFFRDNPV
jgi:hypothetical protein